MENIKNKNDRSYISSGEREAATLLSSSSSPIPTETHPKGDNGRPSRGRLGGQSPEQGRCLGRTGGGSP